MELGNTVELMKIFDEIQKEMKNIGKIDWIMNVEDEHCLASFYFMEEKCDVGSNRKILSCIKKLEKKFIMVSYSVGKTVTFYLKEKEKK